MESKRADVPQITQLLRDAEALDAFTRMGMGRIVAPFYPYLVVEIRMSPS